MSSQAVRQGKLRVQPKTGRRKERSIRFFDYTLLFIIIFLVCFGLVMLYSTSSYNAQLKFGDSAYYLKRQLFASGLGFVGMFVVSRFDYHFWARFAGLGYIAAIGLCVFVIFGGTESHGQARWLRLGPLQFQPSEFAKIAVILFLATIISRAPKKMAELSSVLRVFALLIPILAPVAYTNLSTAIIIAGIAIALTFVASPKYMHFIILGIIAAIGVILFIVLASYRATRIQIWLHPEQFAKGYQTLQGLYAIGSGGLFGKGLGESMQKLGFLPEAQNDMIFPIICEELGLFGAICVILLFLLMLWRLMVIANNAQDLFGSLLVVGIMAHIAIQVILNIAVVTNSIPNTGITLPLVSYGGTSASFLLTELGLAFGVSKGIKLEG